jgi:glyoxylase-like metal-dependent hydrolase (beta-lactamase superfamily II)
MRLISGRHASARLATLTGLVALAPVAAQETDPLRANARGLALIDSAIVAHGGTQRLLAIQDMTLRYRGQRWLMYQSETFGQPWSVQPTLHDVVVDFRGNRIMQYWIDRFPGDIAFVNRQVVTPQGTVQYDPTRSGRGDALTRSPGAAAQSHHTRRDLPAFLLLFVRERAESVRWVGERTADGRRLHGVSYAQPNGSVYTLWIDAITKRLRVLEWVRDDLVSGDQVARFEYLDYRLEQGVPVPTRRRERWSGQLVREDTVTITIDSRPADSLFALPSTGFGEPVPAAEPEQAMRLADNVWLVPVIGGNRVMIAAFRDYVLAFETPTPAASATAVLETVQRMMPGKPVRYVTFSHHHDDHAGGLRPYIVAGTTIVTTPLARRFVEHVANARHTMRPDELSLRPRQPSIETFTGKRVFTDGDLTVELHHITTSHAREMVFAYVPRARLVFQGDLLSLPVRGDPRPATAATAEFAAAIERLGLDVETIAGVHGRVGTIAELRAAVAMRSAASPMR